MKYRAYKNEFLGYKNFFQVLPFYDVLIEKPKIKHLLNLELFYDELSVVKKSNAFKGHTRGYKVEIIDPKDPSVQLEAIKSSVEHLLKDLLNEIKT